MLVQIPACLTLLTLGFFPQVEGPFHDLTVEEALKLAGEDEKVVMIDFYTTWCAPCKELDRVTWKDRRVQAWLDEETIAIKVDAEEQATIAARYTVKSYPSLVFLGADGTEMDRLIGFKTAEKFLSCAADVLVGRSHLSRLRDELEAKKGEYTDIRREVAKEAARRGEYEEALGHYLWCWDHGLQFNPSFYGVRRSFLLNSIHMLGASYPPAIAALRSRRDECASALRKGKADSELAKDLAAINYSLGENQHTLAVYDGLSPTQCH